MKYTVSVKRMAVISILTAAAIALSIIESFIPGIGIPGIKLGFANIIVLLVLLELGVPDALLISLTRILITSVFRGTLLGMGFVMSITGGALSFIIMLILIKLFKKFSVIGISVIGSLFHVFGQIVIAMIYLGTAAVLYYLPFIALSAIGTGILVGLIVYSIQKTKVIEKSLNNQK